MLITEQPETGSGRTDVALWMQVRSSFKWEGKQLCVSMGHSKIGKRQQVIHVSRMPCIYRMQLSLKGGLSAILNFQKAQKALI